MKRIDFNKMIYDNNLYSEERKEILGMEFIRQNDGNYLIKNSNGRVVSEKEKLQLENNEMVIKDVESNLCQKEATKKISNNKKRIKELNDKPIEETTTTE